MWLMYGERTNKEIGFIAFIATEAQLRTVGEAMTQSPQWNDVFFVHVNDPHVHDRAKQYTFDYFCTNPEFNRKPSVDPLVQALFEEQPEGEGA